MVPSLPGQSRPAEVQVAIPESLLLGTLRAGVHLDSARFAHVGRLHPHARAAGKSLHASSGTCCCTTRKYGVAMASKQLKHMAELDASIQERGVETQVKSTHKAVEVAAPCAYREPEDVSRRLRRAEMQYESQIETQEERYIPMKSINKAVNISAQTMRNVLKRNSIRFAAAALLAALVIFVASPKAA